MRHLGKRKYAAVAEVTTRGRDGAKHTRPFSFVNKVVGSQPPEIGITMLKPGGKTLANIKATKNLQVDGKPFSVSRLQDAEVVFANEVEKTAFLDELLQITMLRQG